MNSISYFLLVFFAHDANFQSIDYSMIVRELIETEEDLIRDMQFVVRTYIRQSDSSITPKEIRSVKDDIFHCYKELLEFHKDILLKNFQTLAKEPSKIGTLFLRIQSDFINHSRYCQNLPKALAILDDNSDVAEYFNVSFLVVVCQK